MEEEEMESRYTCESELMGLADGLERVKIGRASCRERV